MGRFIQNERRFGASFATTFEVLWSTDGLAGTYGTTEGASGRNRRGFAGFGALNRMRHERSRCRRSAGGPSEPCATAATAPYAAPGRFDRLLEADGRRQPHLLYEFRPRPGGRPRHDRTGGGLPRQLLHQPKVDFRARRADHA